MINTKILFAITVFLLVIPIINASGNPFRNAKPELNLVRVFDSPNTNIVLGDSTRTIRNAAVLREGVTESWGYKHIFETRIDGANHGVDIMRRFGLKNEEEVTDLIGKSLKYGENKGIFTNPVTGEKAFQITYTQNSKELLIVVSAEQKNFGSIITAYPN